MAEALLRDATPNGLKLRTTVKAGGKRPNHNETLIGADAPHTRPSPSSRS